MGHSVQYRTTYLTALAAVIGRGYSTVSQHVSESPTLEEPVPPDSLNLLLGDLEDQRCGSEFLSQALYAASLLLSQWPDSRFSVFFSHLLNVSIGSHS